MAYFQAEVKFIKLTQSAHSTENSLVLFYEINRSTYEQLCAISRSAQAPDLNVPWSSNCKISPEVVALYPEVYKDVKFRYMLRITKQIDLPLTFICGNTYVIGFDVRYYMASHGHGFVVTLHESDL